MIGCGVHRACRAIFFTSSIGRALRADSSPGRRRPAGRERRTLARAVPCARHDRPDAHRHRPRLDGVLIRDHGRNRRARAHDAVQRHDLGAQYPDLRSIHFERQMQQPDQFAGDLRPVAR